MTKALNHKSAISTSLIHCITSVKIFELVHTPLLNLIFQQANVAVVGEFIKMKIWDLQSLVICTNSLKILSKDDWTFGWRSRLASLILIWCLVSILHRLWRVDWFWYLRTPWIQFLLIMGWRRRCWIYKKRLPIYHVCPKCLAAPLRSSAFLQNDLAFHQELDEVGMTLVDWWRGNVHCVQI